MLPNCSLWWRDVRMLCCSNLNHKAWFLDSVSFKLGKGNNISFWYHNWAGNFMLKNILPNLYEVCDMKDATVADFGWWDGGLWRWNFGPLEDTGRTQDAVSLRLLLGIVAPV